MADEELVGLADLYASSLLAVANEAGQTDDVAEQLAEVAEYMERDPDFRAFMTAATVDDDVRRPVLDRWFRGRMNDLLLNLLHVINDRFRAEILPAVANRFRLLLEKQRGEIEVEARTAVPLADDLRDRLTAMLSEALRKQVILRPAVDSSLIGGIVIEIGDRRIDASLARRLAVVHEQLRHRASEEVHQGTEYFLAET